MPRVTGAARILALGMSAWLAGCGAGMAARDTVSSRASTRHDASARSGVARVRLAQIGSFREPVYVAGAPADPGRIFIVERAGTVRLVLNGRPQTRPFLDITRLVKSADGEQGLLGLAFSPDYASSGLFYVYYTTASNNNVFKADMGTCADMGVAFTVAGATSLSTIGPLDRTLRPFTIVVYLAARSCLDPAKTLVTTFLWRLF